MLFEGFQDHMLMARNALYAYAYGSDGNVSNSVGGVCPLQRLQGMR
jgi:hypothetical protein